MKFLKALISFTPLFIVWFGHPSLCLADSGQSYHHTLNEVVDIGVHSNLDLLAAKYNIPEAEADELTAGLFNNPSLLMDTVFQPFSKNWNQTNAGGPRQYDLILSYPFDLSGKRSAAEKSAHEATRATEASFQDAVRQKIRDIRLAYFDLLVAEQQLTLAHEKEDRLTHLVDVLEKRIGQKQILPLLKLRAQVARDQAKLDAEQREISLRAAKTNIAILLGYAEGTTIIPETKLRDFTLGDIPLKDSLMNFALEQRPDLKALKLTLNKSSFDKELAHAQVWDNFTVTAGMSSQGPAGANPSDANSNSLPRAYSWNMGLTVPLPSFNRNQGNIAKASLLEEQLNKQIASLHLSITQEVSTLYDQILAGKHLLEAYEEKQLKQAREVRDAQSRLFGTGSSAVLDYFDSINAYIAVYSSYYHAVGDYRRNTARLNAALGKDEL